MDTRAFYDRISGVYDVLADSSEGACRNEGLAALQPRPGEQALEIGCGTGHALAAMADAVGVAGHVYGVDVSTGMFSVARRLLPPYPNVTLINADARHLCVRTASLDVVFMSFTLELFSLKDMGTVLREIRRAVRPGGRLGVVSMGATAHDNVATRSYKWMHHHFPHFVDCRPIDVLRRVREAQFDIVASETMSIWGLTVMSVTARRPFDGAAPSDPGA